MKTLDFINKILGKVPKITEKNKYHFLGGVLAVILIFDYFVIMGPQLKTLSDLNAKIAVLRKEITETREDIPKIHLYRANVKDLKEEMKTLGNRIMLKEQIPEILELLSRISNETNVRIRQIMPMKSSEKLVLKNEDGRYYSINLLITARAGYHDIGRFFNRIETDDVFMSITDFDIASNSEDNMKHALKANIKIFLLKKSEEKEKK